MIFVKVRINGKGPFLFLLNTGANRSVVDSVTAAKLQLPQTGYDSVEGTAGKIRAALVNTTTLQLGTITRKGMSITRRNLKNSFLPAPAYLHGIIGTDFLQHYVMQINFKARQIQLVKAYKAPKGVSALRFDWEDGIPSFATVLNDTFHTRLRYNSGVSMNTDKSVYINLPQDCWDQLNLSRRLGAPQRYISGSGVGGSVYLAIYPIDRMQMENLDIAALQAIIQPREGYFKRKGATGFFGNNMLEKYFEAVFDFPNQVLILPKVKARVKPKAATVAK